MQNLQYSKRKEVFISCGDKGGDNLNIFSSLEGKEE